MAFCKNCGQELSEGTKFCDNCGTKVEESTNLETVKAAQDENTKVSDTERGTIVKTNQPIIYTDGDGKKVSETDITTKNRNKFSIPDSFGNFFGILLFILALVDMFSDPAIVTILLSIGIIIGAFYCFARKFKLKFFTVLALILAIICLLLGINQSKEMGLFTTPEAYRAKQDAELEEWLAENPVSTDDKQPDKNNTNDDAAVTAETNSDTENVSESEETTVTEPTTETTNDEQTGVDPDLKAFLDSYEEFMDEYVEFMKVYSSNPNNAVAMIGEYMELMNKLAEFEEKANAYNQDEMSDEDLKYYLEVMARIEGKMITALK